MMVARKKPNPEQNIPIPLFPEATFSTPQLAHLGASFNDPAFAANKTFPFHRWVPWIAGFSRDFVQDALHRFAPPHGVVLDPFAGVGTTLIEAMFAGHQAIGFEINPYASFASTTKMSASTLSTSQIWREIAHFGTFCAEKTQSPYHPQHIPPLGFKTRADFYSAAVLHKVLMAQDFIATMEDAKMRDLFRLAFAATMVRYSNYSYEPSLGRRVSSGKEAIIDFPVAETIAAKLEEMATDIEWLHHYQPEHAYQGDIINDTFFNYHQHLEPNSVDVVITSPPYLNNYHYNRNTRPQMLSLIHI